MEVGRVIGTITATIKHEAYQGRRLLVVQEMNMAGEPKGPARVAVDYVGAGLGDLVLTGGAPGVAASVFDVKKAPIRELVMGIVDRVDVDDQLTMSLYDEYDKEPVQPPSHSPHSSAAGGTEQIPGEGVK